MSEQSDGAYIADYYGKGDTFVVELPDRSRRLVEVRGEYKSGALTIDFAQSGSDPQPAPVDWPARFRAAADVADDDLFGGDVFRMVASMLERWPARVVEAIGRELLGEPQ
jgi:hypothetical protein